MCASLLMLAACPIFGQQDHSVPVGSITAAVVLPLDTDLVEEGTEAREAFERNFQADIAAVLSVEPSHVIITDVDPGGTVDFAVVPGDDGTARTAAFLRSAFDSPVALPSLANQTVLGISGEATALTLEDVLVITLSGAEEPETSPTVFDEDVPDKATSGEVHATTRLASLSLSAVALLAVMVASTN